MSNDLTKPAGTGIATTGMSPWEQVRRLSAKESAQYIVYKKGDYMRGDDDVSGQTFEADPLEVYYGWQCWKNQRPVNTQMVRIDQLQMCPRREDLGDLDREAWETGPDGEPKDPWARTVRLGLIDPETKELSFFTSSSYGGRDAVNAFCGAFEKDRLRFPGQVPVVQLDSESYKHKTSGKVMKPRFTITGWKSIDGSAPAPVDAKKQVAEFLNDDLPDFDAAF